MDLCSCVFSKGIVYLSFLYIIFAPALALYPSQPWLYMPLLGFISSLNPWLFGWISLLVVEPILAILNQQPEESPKKLIMSIQISTSNWRLLDDIPILVGNSQRQQWCYSTVASECSYASQSSLPDHQVEIPSNSDQPTNQPTNGFCSQGLQWPWRSHQLCVLYIAPGIVLQHEKTAGSWGSRSKTEDNFRICTRLVVEIPLVSKVLAPSQAVVLGISCIKRQYKPTLIPFFIQFRKRCIQYIHLFWVFIICSPIVFVKLEYIYCTYIYIYHIYSCPHIGESQETFLWTITSLHPNLELTSGQQPLLYQVALGKTSTSWGFQTLHTPQKN